MFPIPYTQTHQVEAEPAGTNVREKYDPSLSSLSIFFFLVCGGALLNFSYTHYNHTPCVLLARYNTQGNSRRSIQLDQRARAQKSLIQREHSRQASSRQHCTTLWVTGLKAREGDVRDGKRDCTLPGKRARGAHNRIARNRAREMHYRRAGKECESETGWRDVFFFK